MIFYKLKGKFVEIFFRFLLTMFLQLCYSRYLKMIVTSWCWNLPSMIQSYYLLFSLWVVLKLLFAFLYKKWKLQHQQVSYHQLLIASGWEDINHPLLIWRCDFDLKGSWGIVGGFLLIFGNPVTFLMLLFVFLQIGFFENNLKFKWWKLNKYFESRKIQIFFQFHFFNFIFNE